MAYKETVSGRPNTSGTRGGVPGQRPFPEAPDQYQRDNEQEFRRQLQQTLTNIRNAVANGATNVEPPTDFFVENGVNSGVSVLVRLIHETTGTPAIGIGTGLQFLAETANGVDKVGGEIDAVATSVTSSSEAFQLLLKTMQAGTLATRARLGSGLWVEGANSAEPGTGGFSADTVGVNCVASLGKQDIVVDSSSLALVLSGYASSGSPLAELMSRGARGSRASPSAVQSGDTLGVWSARGYGATAYATSARAAIRLLASQAWTDSHHGTKLDFQLTPIDSTTIATVLSLDASGNLFFISGSKLDFNSGDVTVTHSSNLLTLAGGDLSLPNLFVGSGGKLDFNSGDVVITHSSNLLSLTGGVFDVPTSGLSINSVVVPTPGLTAIASGSLSGSAVTITNIPAIYSHLVLEISGASSGSTEQTLVQVSTNNGSSYDATAANYPGFVVNVGAVTSAASTVATITDAQATRTAAQSDSSTTYLYGYQGGAHAHSTGRMLVNTTEYQFFITYIGSTSAINALKILGSSGGTFDAGTYTLYGAS